MKPTSLYAELCKDNDNYSLERVVPKNVICWVNCKKLRNTVKPLINANGYLEKASKVEKQPCFSRDWMQKHNLKCNIFWRFPPLRLEFIRSETKSSWLTEIELFSTGIWVLVTVAIAICNIVIAGKITLTIIAFSGYNSQGNCFFKRLTHFGNPIECLIALDSNAFYMEQLWKIVFLRKACKINVLSYASWKQKKKLVYFSC